MTTPTTVQIKLKLRSDTAANWTSTNPTLLAGELGRETDTGKIKIGDGSTAWTSLAYQPFGAAITNADISATAEIAVSKLADGAARQLLQTAADGTNVEWTSNVDVPGTLDVTGAATFDGAVTISGDLTVNGTTTNINTTNLVVEDKNIIIADVTTPTDTTADGGGLTLKGATDKLIQWLNATGAWTFSEHVDIANGKEYRINGTKVLDATSLGATVVSSSLTSVGTIATGTWNASTIAVNKGGTGQTTYTDGQLLIGNTTGNTLTKSTLTAGTGITITNGTGSITIATTALPSTGGTVTGAITAPAFIPNGSTAPTNGLYLPATNSVGLSSDSVPRMIAGSSEAVFNETGADYDFRVEGDTNANLFFVDASTDTVVVNGNSGFGLGSLQVDAKTNDEAITIRCHNISNEGGKLVILSNSGAAYEYLRLYSNSVGSSLDARNKLTFTVGDPIGAGSVDRLNIGFSETVVNETGANYDFRIEGDTNANLFFVDASADRIGIGTSSPAAILSSKPSASSTTATTTFTGDGLFIDCADTTDGNGNYGGAISWSRSGSSTTRAAAITNVQTATDPDVQGLAFLTHSSTTSTNPLIEAMRITGAGLVGIGTTSPSGLLHVANLGTTGTTADNLSVFFSSANRNATVNIIAKNTESSILNLGDDDSSSVGRIVYEHTSNYMAFDVNASERARIDSSGRLLVGTSSSRLSTNLEVEATSGSAGLSITRNSANTSPSVIYLSKTRATSVGGVTAVVDGDRLGSISFQGADGSTVVPAAEITAAVDGTPGANDMPGRLIFATTADGAAAPTERMRISNSGTTTLTSAASTAPFVVNIGASEKARIDSSGRLLVGTSTARLYTSLGYARFQVEGTGFADSSIGLTNNQATVDGSYLVFNKTRGTSVGSVTSVQSGDLLGSIWFQGADGTSQIRGATIEAEVDGTPGANDMPGRLVFSTTADGASSPTERLRITNDGVRGYNQPAPVAVDATATLTVANLKTGIITSTTAAAVTMTLPTGTLTEGGFSGLYTNFTFEWTVINTGATNAVTVQAGTDHTLVGSGAVAAGVSGRFASRRTAANTFVTYRLS